MMPTSPRLASAQCSKSPPTTPVKLRLRTRVLHKLAAPVRWLEQIKRNIWAAWPMPERHTPDCLLQLDRSDPDEKKWRLVYRVEGQAPDEHYSIALEEIVGIKYA